MAPKPDAATKRCTPNITGRICPPALPCPLAAAPLVVLAPPATPPTAAPAVAAEAALPTDATMEALMDAVTEVASNAVTVAVITSEVNEVARNGTAGGKGA